METLKEIQKTAEKLLNLIGLNEPSVSIDEEGRRLTIFVNEGDWFVKQWLPRFLGDFERLLNLAAKRYAAEPVFIDINNYRKKREELIIELARAAARKALATKDSVELPAMNAYERRLVHTELAGRPDVATESIGERKDRRVIIRQI
jgi:predicted RNA-binding protein Jag